MEGLDSGSDVISLLSQVIWLLGHGRTNVGAGRIVTWPGVVKWSGEKRSNFGSTLKVEPTRYPENWERGCEKNKAVQDCSRGFS